MRTCSKGIVSQPKLYYRMTSDLRNIEIMDSTLRDGEQTNGVSFLPHEKLSIARMLLRDVKARRMP